jgi:NAD(P)-dependent dehydrogenase (short-subunit alcohol dehydrogenase family)
VAVVTGASRGIGVEVARELADRGLEVVLTARDLGRARRAAELLWDEGLDDVHPRAVDVTDDRSVGRLADALPREFGPVDVLVNNAGVYPDANRPVLAADLGQVREIMETNVYGAWRMAAALVPGMRRRGRGRVVNVSSAMGSLAGMGGGAFGYRLSKAGINVLTRTLAAEIGPDEDVLVNSASPGSVGTPTGGPGADQAPEEGADRTPEEAADTIVWLATLPAGGPTGGFFADRQPLEP